MTDFATTVRGISFTNSNEEAGTGHRIEFRVKSHSDGVELWITNTITGRCKRPYRRSLYHSYTQESWGKLLHLLQGGT